MGSSRSIRRQRRHAFLFACALLFPRPGAAQTAASGDLRRERWDAENPAPGTGASSAALEAWARRLLKESREWTEATPDDPVLWLSRIEAVTFIKDLPASEVEPAADGFLAALEKRPDSIHSYPPPRSQVAQLYLAKGLRLPDARRLVERDLAEAEKTADGATSMTPERKGREVAKLDEVRWSCRPILVEVCARTGDLSEAKATLASMRASLSAEEGRPDDSERGRIRRESMRATIWIADAEIAGAEKRFSDALESVRKALVIAIAEKSAGLPEFEKKAHMAFAAAGRSEQDWKGWLADTTRLVDRADPLRGWEQPRRPLPDFQVKDVAGKTWTRADFRGKAVLINFWATWCIPCRAELPQIQALWEKTRRRKDLLVLTASTDRDTNLVSPFLRKNGYRFPVLLAADFFEKNVVDARAVPQIWLISKGGDIVLARSGFDPGDPQWSEKVLALLDEVGRDHPGAAPGRLTK